MGAVTQEWTHELSMMQQSVLLTAIRGPDGQPKYGPVKMLLRWYRRCILLSAIDGRVLGDPFEPNGGSFTGPSLTAEWNVERWQERMDLLVGEYLKTVDAIPHHFHMHLLDGAEILGYKHPKGEIRRWWHRTYLRLVKDLHLKPELEAELDERLGDSRENWLKHADEATVD